MNPKLLRGLGMTVVTVVLAFLMVAVLLADDSVDASKRDGRLNVAEWVGGHAVYCVDHTGTPTSSGWSDGGIRVLNGEGQVVFFASAAAINAANAANENVLIKTEGGLSLYRQTDGGFSINGLDQWGKPYTFVFADCVPIGPIPYTHAGIPGPSATPEIVDPCFIPQSVPGVGPQGC